MQGQTPLDGRREGVSRRTLLKRAAVVGASTTAPALLAACGSSSSSGTASHASQSGSPAQTITFLKGPWVPNEPSFVQKHAAGFYSDNPKIRVKEIEYQWATRDQDLTRAFASSSVPDATYFSEMYWARYAAANALAPLDEFIANDSGFQSTRALIPASLWKQSQWKGKTYALPWITGLGTSVIANLDLLEQAGVKDWNSSIGAMRAAAHQVRQRTGKWGYAMGTTYADGSWLQIAAYISSAGASIYNGDFTKAALNTPGFVANLSALQGIYTADKSAPAAGLYQSTGLNPLWLGGKVGIYCIAGADSIGPAQLQGAKFKIGIAPHPGPNPGSAGSYLGVGHLAISANSPHKQAAWEWIKYLISRQGVLPWEDALTLQYLASRRDMTVNLYNLHDPVQAQEANSYRRLVASGIAKPFPAEPHLAPVQVVISNEFQSCLSGHQSPQTTASNMESQINNILQSPV